MRAKTFPELRSTITAYSHLQDGWDGGISRAIDPDVLVAAQRVVDVCESLDFTPAAVCPTSGSGIVVHFQRGAVEADLDIRPDGIMETWVGGPTTGREAPARNVINTAAGVQEALEALRRYLGA